MLSTMIAQSLFPNAQIRVAFYAQVLLGWFMSLIWPDTFIENSRAAYMTALALLIASFIELETRILSLLDGLVVSFITTMMITFAIASYSRIPASTSESEERDKSADEKMSFSGEHGNTVNCDTNYGVTIQLFKQVHPTDPIVRNAALALVAIGTFIALLSLFITLEQFVAPVFWAIKSIKERRKQTDNQDTSDREMHNIAANEAEARHQGSTDQETLSRGFVKYEHKPNLQAIHVVFQALAVGTFIFLIYITERTISQNDRDGRTKNWSYGQTIAMLLFSQQIMRLCSTLVEQRGIAEAEQ
ncbi:unnamed protein product [Rhizoctonia solani]|uniref:Uncharacterized protein n=1 Tax=Rhizoctonia solani TaxID=456999 RepID=A0A8H2XRG8_9AGAM|nr:unnamed protein product [Rhizoctonia solani]